MLRRPATSGVRGPGGGGGVRTGVRARQDLLVDGGFVVAVLWFGMPCICICGWPWVCWPGIIWGPPWVPPCPSVLVCKSMPESRNHE